MASVQIWLLVMCNWFRVIRYFLLVVTGSFLITACAFRHQQPTEGEQVIQRDTFIADGGYRIARSFEITQSQDRWEHDGKYLDITLLVPIGLETYPLVIYLPGLGEQANSGRLWREYWAKAGYVVLSIQPQTVANAFADVKPMLPFDTDKEPIEVDDEIRPEEQSDDISKKGNKRPSQTARNAELRYIGREFFSEKSLQAHMEQVLWAYKQSLQRIRASQGLFAKADLSNVFVAGYDIGARIVTTLVDAPGSLTASKENDFNPKGAILISPPVDASSGGVQKRYRNIDAPLLVISSEEDDDPYGITTPMLRRVIWDNAISDYKHLLLLKQANHSLLSGSGWNISRSGMAFPTKHGSDAALPDMDHFQGGHPGQNGGPPPGGRRPPFPGGHSMVPVYQEVAVIASVSTAFMDSIAKKDMFAALWLIKNAKSWLKSVANLTIEQHRY